MSRYRYFGLCVLTLTGAFAGSYAANHAVPVAHAQNALPPAEVRATSFTLVNAQGQTQATLHSAPAGAELQLNDPRGNVRVEISPSGGLVIRDAFGRITWRSPKGSGVMPATAE